MGPLHPGSWGGDSGLHWSGALVVPSNVYCSMQVFTGSPNPKVTLQRCGRYHTESNCEGGDHKYVVEKMCFNSLLDININSSLF